MATRPWVTSENVRSYTNYSDVVARTDEKLEVDISRAETYVIKYTNNKFNSVDAEGNELKIPESIRIAVILLAENYAHMANDAATKTIKSETFDDYSYTAESRDINIRDMGLEVLLDEYKVSKPKNEVTMKLRRL